MDRILIILKKENGPRALSAPALGLNTIIFKHVYWYMQQTQVSVYRTVGPLVFIIFTGKNVDIFPISGQNVDRNASPSEYPQSMFWIKNKKNLNTPANPS